MKNIQVIDGADNCTYDIYGANENEFDELFPGGTDVEFIEDAVARLGDTRVGELLGGVWQRPLDKKHVQGIHGTLFFELLHKKVYYPTKKEAEAVALGGQLA